MGIIDITNEKRKGFGDSRESFIAGWEGLGASWEGLRTSWEGLKARYKGLKARWEGGIQRIITEHLPIWWYYRSFSSMRPMPKKTIVHRPL